jgi:hypothetical protein
MKAALGLRADFFFAVFFATAVSSGRRKKKRRRERTTKEHFPSEISGVLVSRT